MKANKNTVEHYKWKDVCDGWHFVKKENISVILERMPAHTSEDMHFHEKAHQFFYMLSGVANMILDNIEVSLCAGEGIEVEPMKLHQIKNDSDDAIEFIVISAPKSHGDKIIV